jgi:hypothetical protein
VQTIQLSRNDTYKSLLLVNDNHPLPTDYQPGVLINVSNTSSSPIYLQKIAGTVLMAKFIVMLWRSMYGS